MLSVFTATFNNFVVHYYVVWSVLLVEKILSTYEKTADQ